MIALVPMRSGSKGIPDKNIKDFLGRPLFYWNIRVLLDYGAEVSVSTDSQKYIDMVSQYFPNIKLCYRSKRTSTDNSTTIELVQEFIEKEEVDNAEIFMLSQVTSPYLKAKEIITAIDKRERAIISSDFQMGEVTMSTSYYDSVMSVGRTNRYLWNKNGCINWDGIPKPRQEWEGTMIQNGCLYVTTAGMIRKTASLWGGRLGFLEQPYSFELDTPADWAYGEEAMRGKM